MRDQISISQKVLCWNEVVDLQYRFLKGSQKATSVIIMKNSILMILKLNAFRFGKEYYRQITGTAMGTPMTPNYANLFMDNFEQTLPFDFFQQTRLSHLVWFRFIEDVFFIWTGNKDLLDSFIFFTRN